ncbi:MAG TPA: Hsp70 family protein, partial [Pilimelia sp.]|nr:Hsp70 family protein [Pilimelia sp.]
VLRAAARVAGLPHPLLVAEPVAAARYLTVALGAAVPPGRAVAVYDLGGGTFDAAVVRRTGGPTGFEVLAERGLPDLGGVDFDHALVEHLGRTYADTRTTRWRGLTAPADTGQRRARALLYDDVRAAKESLSRATSADVHLPALDIDAHVTRAELEDLIRPRLGDTVACLAEAIAAARLTPAELAGVLLVGGSSRIPLAAHLIHARLGLAPTTLEQPETAVALGALHGAFAGPPAGPAVVGGGPVTRGGPPPVVPYPQPPPEPAPRPWYAEPIALATVVLFVLVLIAAGVLIALVVG